MRFVAQHYKVVSLASLLEHLEEGRPETLISITFDDGYGDNYQNALPRPPALWVAGNHLFDYR